MQKYTMSRHQSEEEERVERESGIDVIKVWRLRVWMRRRRIGCMKIDGGRGVSFWTFGLHLQEIGQKKKVEKSRKDIFNLSIIKKYLAIIPSFVPVETNVRITGKDVYPDKCCLINKNIENLMFEKCNNKQNFSFKFYTLGKRE